MAVPAEGQVKQILSEHGLTTPAGETFGQLSDVELDAVADRVTLPVIVKSLVPIGRKGKAGAVRVCRDRDAFVAAVRDLSRLGVHGYDAAGVYVEALADIAQEVFLSIVFDINLGVPVVLLAAAGGVDVETHAGEQAITRIEVDGPLDHDDLARRWQVAGMSTQESGVLAAVTLRAWEVFVEYDCRTLELNPVVLTPHGEAVVVGALMDIDDNAMFRHPDVEALDRGRFGRSPTQAERRLLDAGEASPRGSIRFMELPGGDFINLVSGGGCSMLSADQMFDRGMRPATYFDATGPSDELWRATFDECLSLPLMRGLIFGANVASIAAHARRMELLVEALQRHGMDDSTRFPVVVRLAGSDEDQARAIAAEAPGVTFFGSDVSIEEAVDHFLDLLQQASPA